MYVGYFKDIDYRDYRVEIIPKGSEDTTIELTLSSEPVTITQKSDKLFSEIKSSGCTIEVITTEIIEDLYSAGIYDVEVYVYLGSTPIFSGYLTPYVYDQPYAHVYDTLQLEAVSRLSVLKDIKYKVIGESAEIRSFKNIIWHILTTGAGYDADSLNVVYNLGIEKTLSDLKISEANFFDDDEEHTPWSMEEVLSEICRYLGVSCYDFKGDVYFSDYQQIAKSDTFFQYYFAKGVGPYYAFKCSNCGNITYVSKRRIVDPTPTVCSSCRLSDTYELLDLGPEDSTISYGDEDRVKTYTKDDFKADDSNLSYDEIYNKFSVNVNGYNIEELSPDILDLKNSKNLSWYPSNQSWTYTEYDRKGNASTSTTFYQYHTYRLLKDTTNWKHRYFRMSDGVELTDYEYWNGSIYNSNNIFNHVNTRCAMIERFAYYDAKSPNPVSLEWHDYIAFFNVDDTIYESEITNSSYSYGYTNCTTLEKYEQPVLEFNASESLRFSPNTGTSYITFNGSLWYQRNWKTDAENLKIVNTDKLTYVTTPVDGITQITACKLVGKEDVIVRYGAPATAYFWTGDRTPTSSNYGEGWPLLKLKLQIGDKYWNGSYWTTTDSTFYLNFSNNPTNGANESLLMFSWLDIVSNHTFTDKINKECYAIPITSADNISGQLKLTIYTPSQMREAYEYGGGYYIHWSKLFPVIFMKDFEMNYVYTDTSSWWLSDDNEESDLVYTNMIYSGFNREYDDDIECKINSYSNSIPISKSFVMTGDNNEFLTTIYNPNTGRTRLMEYHLIEKLLNHYSSKKIIFDASVEYYSSSGTGDFCPYIKQHFDFESVDTFKNADGTLKTFLIDSYTFTPKSNIVNAKFIEW